MMANGVGEIEARVTMLASQFEQHIAKCEARDRDAEKKRRKFHKLAQRQRDKLRGEMQSAFEALNKKVDKAFYGAIAAGIAALAYLTIFWVQHAGPVP